MIASAVLMANGTLMHQCARRVRTTANLATEKMVSAADAPER